MEKFHAIEADGSLVQSEIEEVKQLSQDQEKMQVLLETNQEFQKFIETEYSFLNLDYLKQSGISLAELQEKLGVSGEEGFGKNTFFAIIQFQKANNLEVDGIAGPKTNAKLFGNQKIAEHLMHIYEKQEGVSESTKKEKVSSAKEKATSNREISGNKLWALLIKHFAGLFGKSEKKHNYEMNGSAPSGYENYKDVVAEVTEKYPRISKENLKTLIDHENRHWNPYAKAKGSTAYGLGQMINSTWGDYGYGLERNNPRDQLESTCRYLDAIMKNKGCGIELAMAYYNTGEGVLNISNQRAQKYARLNPAIARKIPAGESVTPKVYFKAAVAYYNNISYEQASRIS